MQKRRQDEAGPVGWVCQGKKELKKERHGRGVDVEMDDACSVDNFAMQDERGTTRGRVKTGKQKRDDPEPRRARETMAKRQDAA